MENKLFAVRRRQLQKWMDDRELTQVDVANRSGKTRSYISLILGAGKSFGEKTARGLEKSLFMPAGYLDNEGISSRLTSVIDWERVEDLDREVFALVPRVAVSLSAGAGSVSQGEEELPPLAFRRDWLVKKNITSRSNLRTCTIEGDSMSPYLEDGDTVLLDMGQTSIKNSEVYAIEHSGDIRIKRLSKTFDGGVTIESDNHRYKPEQLTPEQASNLRILGRLVWRGG